MRSKLWEGFPHWPSSILRDTYATYSTQRPKPSQSAFSRHNHRQIPPVRRALQQPPPPPPYIQQPLSSFLSTVPTAAAAKGASGGGEGWKEGRKRSGGKGRLPRPPSSHRGQRTNERKRASPRSVAARKGRGERISASPSLSSPPGNCSSLPPPILRSRARTPVSSFPPPNITLAPVKKGEHNRLSGSLECDEGRFCTPLPFLLFPPPG